MIAKPTKEQDQAVYSKIDTVVSAAAGSGKTAVMVERVVRLVLEGADIRRMLVITFTNAAAAQLKRRIRSELAAAQTADERTRRTQLNFIRSADIGTVHSLCIRLCRKFFAVAGIDPLFKIAGDIQRSMLSKDALDELFDERFASANEVFRHILFAFAYNSEDRLKQIITDIYEYSRSSPDPEAFLTKAQALYADGENYYKVWEKEAVKNALNIPDYLAEAGRILGQNAQDSEKARSIVIELGSCAERISKALKMGAGPETLSQITDIKIPAMRLSKVIDEETKQQVSALVDKARVGIKALKEDMLFAFGKQYCQKRDKEMLPYIKELCSLVIDYSALFAQRKKEAGVLDFSDVEHYALKILSDKDAACEIRAKYDYVCVDEYQDTNDIQEEIITKIANKGALFCVGDVKQSIYKFRHAEPNIFHTKYSCFREDEASSAIDLNTNFRSTPEILQGVNAVFSKVMSKDCGGVDYDATHTLKAGRQEHSHKPELHIVFKQSFIDEEDIDSIKAEAAVCADIINELMASTYTQDGIEKKFAYDDIAVLMRSAKVKGEQFIQALKERGIPASGSFGELGVTQGMEQMLCLLRAIDSKYDEYALLGAMRSFVGGFTTGELAELRLFAPEDTFVSAVYSFAKQSGPIADKTAEFLQKLDFWREQTRLLSVEELIDTIADQSGLRASYAALDDGGAGQNGIEKLIAKAREYDEYSTGGLWGFLQLSDNFTFSGRDTLAQEQNGAVRVLTVHSSKGLEFPAVINVFAGSRFNTDDIKGIVYEKTIGIGMPYYDGELNSVYQSAVQQNIAIKKKQDSLSEEMRVLYVALTRARERLFVVGTADNNITDKIKIKYKPSEATRPLDWLLANADQNWSVIFHEQYTPTAAVAQKIACGKPGKTEWVSQRLNWEYPYPLAPYLPSKVAASAVGKRIAELKEPSFAQYEKTLTAAEKGTLVHKALLHLDLRLSADTASVEQQINEMVKKGFFSAEQACSIEILLLERFARSSLAKRIIKSQTVLKEAPFNLLLPASQLGFESDEEIMVQGIIDCAFIEDGKWVIVDYKTDRLPPGGAQEIIQRYKDQLGIYSLALNNSTGMAIKTAYLYLLREDLEIQI